MPARQGRLPDRAAVLRGHGQLHRGFFQRGQDARLILSIRAVPLIDISGLEAMTALRKRLNAAGGVLMLAAVNDKVRTMFDRGGLTELIGTENIFWSADQAIVAAEALSCPYCQTEGQTAPVQGLAAASVG